MPSAEACFHALEGVLPWLPVVLAWSANSPYVAGVETGMLSNRAEILAQLPRNGAPPAFRSYAEWEEFAERFIRLGVADDYTRFWWDVRPHPRFGTLEIRMPDQPTELGRTVGFVALLKGLCDAVLEQPPRPYDPAGRGVYQQNRWAASRFGLAAELVHPDGDRVVRASELATELAALAGEDGLDPARMEADRQLEVGRASGLEAVCADLVERTLS
jgi:carboxylate-amine ligase